MQLHLQWPLGGRNPAFCDNMSLLSLSRISYSLPNYNKEYWGELVNMPFRKSVLISAILVPMNPVCADELQPVLIEESLPINPNASEPGDYNRTKAVAADGADFLRQLNGVSVSRFGGRGLELIVRGQSQTRLNVLLDGSYVHGGCPNRMDPPASWTALETYEKVTVLKGVQSLIYGGGGSGGTVLFERDTRAFAQEKGVHGRVYALSTDNGITNDILGDIVASGDKAYVRAFAEQKNADNYEDGDGREVRSSYDHRQGGLVFGLTPTADRLFELTVERNDFEHALYPGAGMDSPEEQGDFYRFRYKDKPAARGVNDIKFEAYLSDVDHLMDNFSERTPPKYPAGTPLAGKPMLRATPTNSKTTGGRLVLGSGSGATTVDWGLDLQRNERTAVLNNMDKGIPKALSFMWPDATIQQVGLFAEATTKMPRASRLKYGLRVDEVDASVDKADDKPALASPNMAYKTYYGVTAQDKSETNVGGLLRYEKDLGDGLSLFSGLSRSVRTADATERYMNKWNMVEKLRWVGNPDIDPEQHHQLDVGVAKVTESHQFSATVFYDDVTDYILRDTARGQNGILQSDEADIYRNVDAELYGAEAEATFSLTDNLDLSGALAYVHATNTTDDRPIPQTPPLNGKVQLDYSVGNWGLGARVRFATKQDRIDEFSKQEVGETPGWQVLDVYGNYQINDTFSLRAGIDNLLDETYAEHASRSNLLDPFAIKVNEPGRTIWLKATAEF